MPRLVHFNETDLADLQYDWVRGVSIERISLSFGVSVETIRKHAKKLDLPSRRNPWTPVQDAFLRKHYKVMEVAEIGKCLKRTRNSVIGRAYKLGLSTPRGVSG